MNRFEKITLGIAILALIVSLIGVYESTQAQSTANDALGLQKRSFEIANNYSYVQVTSVTPLELRPQDCVPIGSSSNVSCSFGGTFNVSFTIIAPQAGTFNVTVLGVIGTGPFSPHPVHYFDGGTVTIGNITISMSPLPQVSSPVQGGVPISSSQPFSEIAQIEVSGFKLEAPADLIGNLNFHGESKLLAMLWFSAFQAPWNNRQSLFIVNVDFLPNL